MTVRFVPATCEHLEYVLANLSVANRDEALAGGVSPEHALRATWAHSEITYTIELDGEVVGLYGLCPTRDPDLGCPWMVGTERLPDAALGIVRHARPVVRGFLARYPRLSNCVDAENARLIRWLRWTGFVVDPPEPIGPNGHLFRRYHMEER
jgi:hypothetical protein